MATALTECGWTWGNIFARSIILAYLHTQRLLDKIGIEFTGTRQLTRQTALDDSIAWHNTTHLILNEGLTLFSNQHKLAIVRHTTNQFLRNRILRNLQHGERTALRIALHQIVVGNTAGDDTKRMVLPVNILVILAVDRHLF